MEVPLVLGLDFVDPAGTVLASGTVAAVTNTSLALTTVASSRPAARSPGC
jgi:hypothetical protein